MVKFVCLVPHQCAGSSSASLAPESK